MEVGNKVKLVREVRGEMPGTEAVIKEIKETGEIILDLGKNDVVLPVQESDIELVWSATARAMVAGLALLTIYLWWERRLPSR